MISAYLLCSRLLKDSLCQSERKKGPSEGNNRKMKAPEDFPEESLGFLEPLAARGKITITKTVLIELFEGRDSD